MIQHWFSKEIVYIKVPEYLLSKENWKTRKYVHECLSSPLYGRIILLISPTILNDRICNYSLPNSESIFVSACLLSLWD